MIFHQFPVSQIEASRIDPPKKATHPKQPQLIPETGAAGSGHKTASNISNIHFPRGSR
jgi:hypothetical protein